MNAYESSQFVVRSLLGNLIGDSPVSINQGAYRIEPEDLDAFPYEREILRLIYFLEANNEAPTLELVKRAASANGMEIAPLDEMVKLTLPNRDVYGAAYSIKSIFMERKRNMELMLKLTNIMNDTRLPLDQRQEAFELIRSYVRESSESPMLHQVSLTQEFMGDLIEAYRKAHTGEQLGPSWPFRQMVEKAAMMRRGELVSLMGKSKYGKTMFGQIFAEQWSWTQEYDTHIYLFETSVKLYWRRFIVRHCLIQGRDIERGMWDIGNDNHPATVAFKEFVRTRVNGEIQMLADGTIKAGSIYIHPAYGKDNYWLEAEINRAEQESKSQDREAVHLIDYLQKIDNSKLDKHNPQNWNGVAAWLKTFTQTQNLYMMCLVQEQEASDDGVVDRQYPKGGNEIVKQSQLFMRLDRFIANNSSAMMVDSHPLMDNSSANGRERFWHQKGQFHSAVQIQIMRANEDAGGNIDLKVENALYRVKEAAEGSYKSAKDMNAGNA